MKLRVVNLFLVSIFFLFSCKQGKKKGLLNEQAQKYLSDYNEFVDTLTTYHPALYEFSTESNFNKKVEQLRNEINNKTTKKEFVWKLSEVISLASCGHSSLGFFNQERGLLKSKEYFPLLLRLLNSKLYVIDNATNEEGIDKGDEILEINGKTIPEILEIIYAHIPSQANIKSSKKMMFNGYNTSYIPYALDFPDTYTVKTSKNKEVTLKSLNQNPPFSPLFSKNHPCQEHFCFTEINKATALLTLRNFAYYGKKTKEYTDFLDTTFKEIREKGCKNLIIDVRGNLGGPSKAGIYLLRHTLQKPFKYYAENGSDFGKKEFNQPMENNFKGKIVFVMNGEGYSTVGHLASIYKDKNRVVFVGDTLGSNQFCSANQKQFKLTNTGFTYSVARNNFFTSVKEKNRKATINPDVQIEQSINDFLQDKDVVLEKAIELTKSK